MPSPAINLSDASMADTFAALVPPLVYEAASKDELEIITFVDPRADSSARHVIVHGKLTVVFVVFADLSAAIYVPGRTVLWTGEWTSDESGDTLVA